MYIYFVGGKKQIKYKFIPTNLFRGCPLIITPDEWATTKQACRDELVVYLFFHPQYILRSTLVYWALFYENYIYIYIISTLSAVIFLIKHEWKTSRSSSRCRFWNIRCVWTEDTSIIWTVNFCALLKIGREQWKGCGLLLKLCTLWNKIE